MNLYLICLCKLNDLWSCNRVRTVRCHTLLRLLAYHIYMSIEIKFDEPDGVSCTGQFQVSSPLYGNSSYWKSRWDILFHNQFTNTALSKYFHQLHEKPYYTQIRTAQFNQESFLANLSFFLLLLCWRSSKVSSRCVEISGWGVVFSLAGVINCRAGNEMKDYGFGGYGYGSCYDIIKILAPHLVEISENNWDSSMTIDALIM